MDKIEQKTNKIVPSRADSRGGTIRSRQTALRVAAQLDRYVVKAQERFQGSRCVGEEAALGRKTRRRMEVAPESKACARGRSRARSGAALRDRWGAMAPDGG